MLRKHHNITISPSTLKRKVKQYKLQRNKVDFDPQVLRNTTCIAEIIDGPGSSVGYLSASVWHALKQKGIRSRVSRSKVEEIVRELDPNGVEARETHRLRRREYTCPGPNKVWHADGYVKMERVTL